MLICKQKIALWIWNLNFENFPLKIWIISDIYFATVWSCPKTIPNTSLSLKITNCVLIVVETISNVPFFLECVVCSWLEWEGVVKKEEKLQLKYDVLMQFAQ